MTPPKRLRRSPRGQPPAARQSRLRGGRSTARPVAGTRNADLIAMCQLLGMNANTPTDVMFSFTGLATRAARAQGRLRHRLLRGLRRAPVRRPRTARACRRWPSMVKRYPIQSDNVIAHIRKATQGRVGAGEHAPVHARAVGPLLGVRAQRRPEGLPPAAARRLPAGRRHRQRARLLLADAGAARRTPACRASRRLTLTLARAGAAAQRARHLQHAAVQRPGAVGARLDAAVLAGAAATRSRTRTLADEDLSVDFAELTTPTTAWP